MTYTIKRVVAVLLLLTLLCMPLNLSLTAEAASVNYEALFKKVMDEIKNSYLYGEELTERELFEGAMEGMFGKLDPYSEFQTPSQNENFTNSISQSFVGIGVRLLQFGDKITIEEVFNQSPAQKGGVQKGDYFKTVDGVDVTKVTIEALLEKVLGEEGTDVKITFGRGITSYTVTLTRARITIPSAATTPLSDLYKGLDPKVEDQIGYISISSFSETVSEDFNAAVKTIRAKGAKYLILDLRDNGGGYVHTAVEIAQSIIPAGNIVTFKDNQGSAFSYTSEAAVVPFEIIALVNGYSASATEFIAGAIQDSKVGTLVGEKTYGKGVAQILMPFDENYTLKLTVEEFFSRNGNKVNGLGISPDYVVEIPQFISGKTKYYPYDQAEEVISVEKILKYLGYPIGTPDQVYDPVTVAAMKKFQKDQGLYVYGVCDFTTGARLNEALQKSVWDKDPQLNKAVELILEKMGEI